MASSVGGSVINRAAIGRIFDRLAAVHQRKVEAEGGATAVRLFIASTRGPVDGTELVAVFDIDGEIDRGAVGLVAGREPDRALVVRNQVRAAGQVLHVAVFLGVIAGQANTERVAHRNIERTFENHDATLARIEFDIAIAAFEIGLGRDHVDRAANRVPAKQEALGSTQDFGSLDVIETRNGRTGAALVQPVLVQADRRVATVTEVDRADAADADEIEEAVLAVAGYTRRE